MYQVSHPLRQHLWLFLCLLVAGLLLLPQTAHAEDNLTIVTEADLAPGGKINGTNWMSGISGERRLHEITMPGTHDTGMANAKAGDAVFSLFANACKKYACTQDLGIDDQLTAGARVFDLRLTDINPYPEIFKDKVGLWLCHGPRAAARLFTFTFYSELPEGKRSAAYKDEKFLTLDQAMEYYFNFLKAHPTETVVVSLACEHDAGHNDVIIQLLKEKLGAWSKLINPSTGKPYIYQQKKSTNDWTITKMPTLADTRGQVVLTTDIYKDGRNLIGYGMMFYVGEDWSNNAGAADVRLCFENHYESGGSNKLEYVEAFLLGSNDPQYQGEDGNDWDEFLSQNPMTEKYSSFLPNPIDHLNYVNTSSNAFKNFVKEDGTQTPRGVADTVHPGLFTGKDALMRTRGVYYGWVNCDFINESIARTIWLNNYPQGGLAYTTIKFKPGKGVGTEKTSIVQTGGQLTFPKNTYELPDDLKKQGYEFVGWEVAESGNKIYQPGQTLSTWGSSTLTATAKYEQTWSGVGEALYTSKHNDLTITLENDLVAKKGDVNLVVPTWARKTLNLNGHTIDRNAAALGLPSSNANRVMEVGGELSIVGPGTIKGGYAPTAGGITIERYGKLSLKDVVFEKNRADDKQSNDIRVNGSDPDPKLGPALKVAGKTQINNGVLLNKGFVIAGVSDLTEGASIRVYTQQAPTSGKPVVISDTLTHKEGDLKYLQSGQKYGIELGKEGEAKDKAILTAAYKVSYNLMGGRYPNGDGTFSNSIPAELVQYGGKAPDKTGASKLGATFDGWYKVGESSKYDFSKPVTSDLALEAHWTTGTFTVKFYLDEGGKLHNQQSVVYGQLAPKVTDPTREGYEFRGWAFRTGYQSQILRFDFNTPIRNSYNLFAVWRPKLYSVTFDSASGGNVATQNVEHGKCATRPANPAKPNNSFAGWYVGDKEYDFSTPVTGNITLKAHWTELTTTYKVTFDGNGDGVTGLPATNPVSVNRNAKVAQPSQNPERTGYNFAGWYTDAACLKAYDFDSPVRENFTLYAKWATKTYAVTFDSHDGTDVSSQTVAHGGKAVRPQNPTRDGYDFAGWYTEDTYQNAYNFTTGVTDNLTLHAKWTIKKYTVTFDGNANDATGDVTGVPQKQTVEHAGKATKPSDPVRLGHAFGGWYTDKDCTEGNSFSFDTSITGDLTLYAKWDITKHEVTFNSDGGTDVDTQYVEHGKTVQRPADPTRVGHVFKGWNDVNNKTYDFDTIVTSNLTLTAQWELEPTEVSMVLVVFDSNGGSAVNATTVTVGGKVDQPGTKPEREGYTFDCWCSDETCQSPYDFDLLVNNNLVLYAKWTPKKHTVTFDSNDGSAVEPLTVDHGSSVARPENPSKDKCAFLGWYANGAYYDFALPVTQDLTLTAQWETLPVLHTVTFNSDGGGLVDTQYVEQGDKVMRPEDPTREGYVFMGWYNENALYNFDSQVSSDLTLTAHWQQLEWFVLFDYNDSTTSGMDYYDARVVKHGEKAAAPTEDPTRYGYAFGGWYTEPTCENEYDFGNGVTEDRTLYAKWTINKYTVTFDSNGGSAVASKTIEHGSTVTQPKPNPTREGYTFVDWYLEGEPYDFDNTPVTGNLTLTALWTINTYTVTFDANGGGSTPNPQPVTHGGFATVPNPQPSKGGHILDGWYVDVKLDVPITEEEAEEIQNDPTLNLYYWVVDNGGGNYTLRVEHDFETDPIVKDTVLHARWTPNTHVLKFDANDGSGTVPDDIRVQHREKAIAPTERPTREGYSFTGWYTSKSCKEESYFDFAAPITSSLTLYAGWTPDYYVVTFVTGESDSQEYQVVARDQKATKPTEDPTQGGYTFGGWYADEGCNTPFDFNTLITDDTMVYGRWVANVVTATFDTDGGTPQPAEQTIHYPAKVNEPEEAPTKDGRAFLGWYVNVDDAPADDELAAELAREIQSDPELNSRYWMTEDGYLRQLYDFDSIPETDLTLYARYEKCIVRFDAEGGAPQPETQTVDYDGSPTKPAEDPVKDGYTFDGWWLEGDDEPFDFETDTVTGDVTLHAHWAEVQVLPDPEEEPAILTVSFDSNGGSAVTPESQQVTYAGLAQRPDDPVRPGYIFLGWYEDMSDALTVQEYEESKDQQDEVSDMQVFDGKVMLSYQPESDPVYYNMQVQAQWALDPEAGLTTEVVLGEGAPVVSVSNLDEVARALVSGEELAQGVIVRLTVNRIDKSTVSDAERAALEAKFRELGATDYQWLDISLVKIVGGVETKITILPMPLKFTVVTPEAMRAAGRTYYLTRVHDGVASVAASGTETALAAESSQFSTYVLAYKGSAPAGPLPRTGDALVAYPLVLLAGVVLIAVGIFAVKRRRS